MITKLIIPAINTVLIAVIFILNMIRVKKNGGKTEKSTGKISFVSVLLWAVVFIGQVIILVTGALSLANFM